MGADDTPGDFIRQSRRIWSPTKIADIWHAEKSAVLNANRGGPRKSQSQHRAHLAIFADRLDRLAKSLSTSLVLHESGECCWSLKYSNVNRVSKML